MRAFQPVAIAAFLVALCAPASARTPEPMELRAGLTVQVDASGKVSAVQLMEKDAERLPATIREPLLADARAWSFDPALRNGQPVPSSTHVFLTLRADPVDAKGDAWALRITRASNGPAVERPEAPRYPMNAIRNGAVARVVVEVDVAADGSVEEARVVEVESSKSRYNDDFVDATLATVDSWRFTPEQVAGQPIAGTVQVPTTYCISGRECFPTDDPAQPVDGEPVALAPVTRLRTELAGRVL